MVEGIERQTVTYAGWSSNLLFQGSLQYNYSCGVTGIGKKTLIVTKADPN